MYISESTIKKILKEAGAVRTSSEAIEMLQGYIDKVAYDTALKAVKLSKHAKRKTVDAADIKLAVS
ncbi:MAG: NFYB/HAP3 family transcription factor subunit [Candidatus Micrarchaeaceae archaeon]